MERTAFGKTLKILSGIDKASECKQGCVQTNGCTVFLINVSAQDCNLYSASARPLNKRARGFILGKLNCELDQKDTGKFSNLQILHTFGNMGI